MGSAAAAKELQSGRSAALKAIMSLPDEALIEAAKRGDLGGVQTAVEHGAHVTATSAIGLSALHFAAQNGHGAVCEYLLNDGADVQGEDKYGRTPIALAAVRGHETTVELLQLHHAALTADLKEKMEAAVSKRQHRVLQIHGHAGDVEAARSEQRRRERIDRERQRKKALAHLETRTGELEERDEKPVVDWVSTPRLEVARVSRLYARPTYVMASDVEAGGETTKRMPFDKADAELDAHGWPTDKTKKGDTPSAFPCIGMDIDEMGTIGGTGLRLYFFLLVSKNEEFCI